MILIGVRCVVSAAHRNPEGQLHGHSWHVTAWFPAGDDALVLQDRLRRACEPFDHADLCHDLARSEALAEAIADALPDAVQIDADRPLEGIFVRYTK